jgi:hypothetical protein
MSLTRTDLLGAAKLSLIACCCLLFLAACGGDDNTAQPPAVASTVLEAAPASTQPAAGAPAETSSTPVAASQVDACALLGQADVEATLGRPVLPPTSELVANLGCCSYGDPEAPVVSAASLCVFTGSDAGYFAGAVAQAAEVFQTSKNNAAAAQTVSGLGDDAYWDEIFNSLTLLSGPHQISLEISFDGDDDEANLAAAKALMAKALERLP